MHLSCALRCTLFPRITNIYKCGVTAVHHIYYSQISIHTTCLPYYLPEKNPSGIFQPNILFSSLLQAVVGLLNILIEVVCHCRQCTVSKYLYTF